MAVWNPWHGCHKYSEGCMNCYVYRRDSRYDIDSSDVRKTKDFNLPIRKNRAGEYKIPSGETVYSCMTSDFFVDEADEWRKEAWNMIRERDELNFLIITKRIDRFYQSLPDDWGNGYGNVAICCTAENQRRADYRIPIFKELPIKRKYIICEPILERIDLTNYLDRSITQVVAGGESGNEARICRYKWILDLQRQCSDAGVGFWFKQTGARFEKDNKIYQIPRRFQHSQARKAGINI